MPCVSGSAYLPHRHIDRANPLLVRVRAPRSTDNRICHFEAIVSESRVILLPGLKPRVVFCGKHDVLDEAAGAFAPRVAHSINTPLVTQD